MLKKGAIGLFFAVAGFFAWSCGDGSVDSLTDTEMMMISRFPSTINYDMLDSIVKACEKDKECWEKAKKTGEIYKGDYTTILRDSSGNIIYQEGDSAFIYDKDGKKLPVFVLSSNSASGGEEDVTTSGSTATSGSSSKRSSASGAGYDDDFVDDYTGNSNGSGSGTSSRQYASTSSSSRNTGNSSSIDLSVLNVSSSSVKVASSTSINIDVGSSSSKINIVASSVSRSSSSQTVVQASSSSIASHSGGGGGGDSGTMCAANTTLSGSCTGSPNPQIKNKTVTYTFKPDKNNTCSAPDNVEWFVNSPSDGADQTYKKYSYNSAQTQYTHNIKYSTAGNKKSVVFSMGGKNVVCDAVTIKADCNTNNSYSCSRKLNSASNNLTKNNPVSYTWTLTKGGCYDVTSITWSGSVSASGSDVYTVTKEFSSAGTYSESISVVDESSTTPKSVPCSTATVRNVTETKPTCSVDGKVWATGASLTVKPKSISGCDYDNDKCGYVLKKTSGGNIASSSSGYNGESLSIAGESSAKTVNYTLALSNKIGNGSCTFDVEYKEPILDTVSTTYKSFGEGIYRVTIGGSEVRNGFGCTVSGSASSDIIGVFNGKDIQSGSWNNLGTKVPVTLKSSYVFILYANPPSGLKCGIGW